jgi:hypothetical protein
MQCTLGLRKERHYVYHMYIPHTTKQNISASRNQEEDVITRFKLSSLTWDAIFGVIVN